MLVSLTVLGTVSPHLMSSVGSVTLHETTSSFTQADCYDQSQVPTASHRR